MAYRDNVEITEESYVPGGLGVEDYLIPNRPHIDWGNTGVSYAGGFGASETRTGGRSFGGEPQVDPEDVDLSDVKPARKRRSSLTNGLFTVADLFKISASMPNVYGQSALQPGSAYLGMTEEEANKRAKIRMEEDPEGKEIDINRAKVLSARAAATDDVELKKKYGAAIKQLLPNETQGLDALTASDFFNSTDNKLKLEQIKGFNKLQQIGLQNQGKLDVAGVNNASREGIAAARNATQLQVHELDNAIKQAIADGKNDTALALQDKRAELQTMIHEMDNLADYDRALMQQQHADWRTQYGQDAATNRTQMQQQGAMDRTVYSQDAATDRTRMTQEGANARNEANNKRAIAIAMMRPIGGAGGLGGSKGTAKEREANEQLQYRMENWDEYVAQQDADLNAIQRAIDILDEDPNASGFRTNLGMSLGGVGIFPKTKADYGELNELTTRVVLEIVKQLNAAGATSSVFNSESEQKRIIGLISDPSADAKARKQAFISFRDRLQRYYADERKKTAWKASKMGLGLTPQQAQQSMQTKVVSATDVNSNRRKVNGGMEW